MNKGLTAIEYEGLEYVLIRIVTAGADFMGVKIPSGRDIRDCLIHTSNGIRFRNESADISRVEAILPCQDFFMIINSKRPFSGGSVWKRNDCYLT